MPRIFYEGRYYSLQPGESILDCLLRHGVDYPYSCQNGICQSCLCRISSNAIDPAWQLGLSSQLKTTEHALACLSKPHVDINLERPNIAETDCSVTITHISFLNHNVLKIALEPTEMIQYHPGQYLNLINPDGLIRSYSMANDFNAEGFIELHVKLVPGGAMSAWLANEAQPGQIISIRGPIGQCFYPPSFEEPFDLLLAGTGTGLSPLIGIAREAVAKGHSGRIVLIHGARHPNDLYYQREIISLASKHPYFSYSPILLQCNGQYSATSIIDAVENVTPTLAKPMGFFCGPPDTVEAIKRTAFLAGVDSARIFSDPFITR